MTPQIAAVIVIGILSGTVVNIIFSRYSGGRALIVTLVLGAALAFSTGWFTTGLWWPF